MGLPLARHMSLLSFLANHLILNGACSLAPMAVGGPHMLQSARRAASVYGLTGQSLDRVELLAGDISVIYQDSSSSN